MKCSQCGHENPEGSQFCGGCGAPLRCPQCGRENPEGAQFCGGCGASRRVSTPIDVGTAASEPPKSSSSKTGAWRVLGFVGLLFVLCFVGVCVYNFDTSLGDSEHHISETEAPVRADTPMSTAKGLNHYEQGEQYLWRDENYLKAVESFTEYIDLNPNDARGYIGRGNSYQELKRYQEALIDYDKAIELSPENFSDVYSKRGHVHRHLGQYLDAIRDYDKHLALDPSNPWSHHYKGMTYRDLEQYDVAIQNWETYVELRLIESADWRESEQAADAYTNIGLAYIEFGQNQKAIEQFDKALSVDPSYSGAVRGKENAVENLRQ